MGHGISNLKELVSELFRANKNRQNVIPLNNSSVAEDHSNGKYPVDELRRHPDNKIKILYLCCGEYRAYGFDGAPEAFLKPNPANEFFYIGDGKSAQWIVYWHRVDNDGKISAVKYIEIGGEKIYENPEIPFNLEMALTRKEKEASIKENLANAYERKIA